MLLLIYSIDSLIYHIQIQDFYDDMRKNSILLDRMDTSNLPGHHPCYT